MKVVLVSNFLTIHQIELCKSFLKNTIVESFIFVSSFGPSGEKKSLSNFENENFVIKAYLSCFERERAIQKINEADLLIFGSGDITLLNHFNKPIYFYSEHFSKDFLFCLRAIHVHFLYRRFKTSYLLCASYYAKKDYNFSHLFKNKFIRFGYFTSIKSIDVLKNKNDPLRILWVGRDLKWKRLNLAFFAANFLSKNGIKFKFTIVAKPGFYLEKMKKRFASAKWINDCDFVEYLANDDVYKKMQSSDLFLLTSNKGEGWGAVLSEAMSCGCCCISSIKAGATNFLIKDGHNGYSFKRKKDLFKKLLFASQLSNDKFNQIRLNAVETIRINWNADNAVSNLVDTYLFLNRKSSKYTYREEPGVLYE